MNPMHSSLIQQSIVQHILPRSSPPMSIHTVVHSDTHVYIDTFTTLYDATTFIDENAPGQNAWKVISKVVR